MRNLLLATLLSLVTLGFGPGTAHAWGHDPYSPSEYFNPPALDGAMVSDNAGGAVVLGSTGYDLYANHILADGSVDATWSNSGFGRFIATSPGTIWKARTVSDGGTGYWVLWQSGYDGSSSPYSKLFASHLLANGAIAPGVPVNGIPIAPALTKACLNPSIAVDYLGNLGVAFQYDFSGNDTDNDIYAVRISKSTNAVSWMTAVATATGQEKNPSAAFSDDGKFGVLYTNLTSNILRVSSLDISGLSTGSYGISLAPSAYPALISGTTTGFMVAFKENASTYLGFAMLSGATLNLFTYNSVGLNAYPVALINRTGGRHWLVWNEAGSFNVRLHVNQLNDAAMDFSSTFSVYSGSIFGMYASAMSDGLGGLLLHQSGVDGYIMTRVMSNGTIAPTWSSGASGVLTSPYLLASDGIRSYCPDGKGGAIVLRKDYYYLHLDRWGAYNAEPANLAAKDIVADQGGKVRLSWDASYLDTGYPNPISSYRIWRQVVATSAVAMSAHPTDTADEPLASEPTPGTVRWRMAPNGAQVAWEYLGSSPAAGLSQYSYSAATGQDSTATGAHDNAFQVEAVHATYGASGITWFSNSVTGHSVDNLPPFIPAPFKGIIASGGTNLRWGPNAEADLAGYRLYRGSSAGFTPSPANLVTETTDTTAVDAGRMGDYYKLSAVDIHGNESPFALLTPAATLDAPGGKPVALEFALASANPSRGAVALRLALPSAGRVRVAMYDVRGREVRVLRDARVEAGLYAVTWDGRDASGAPAGEGVYFARLETAGRALTQRVVRLN
jgi:hypothetical protein